MIYFAQAEEGGPVKVGYSARPDLRIAQLSPALRLLSIRHGTFQDEQAIHKKLVAHRINGEWYRPCEEVMAEVVAETDAAPDAGEEFERALRAVWPLLIEAAFENTSNAKIAKLIGVTEPAVRIWRKGKSVPNTPAALALAQSSELIRKFLHLMVIAEDPLHEAKQIAKLLEQRGRPPA